MSREYGRGYEIYINDPAGATLVLSGQVPKNAPEYNLSSGWNLIAATTVDTREEVSGTGTN